MHVSAGESGLIQGKLCAVRTERRLGNTELMGKKGICEPWRETKLVWNVVLPLQRERFGEKKEM